MKCIICSHCYFCAVISLGGCVTRYTTSVCLSVRPAVVPAPNSRKKSSRKPNIYRTDARVTCNSQSSLCDTNRSEVKVTSLHNTTIIQQEICHNVRNKECTYSNLEKCNAMHRPNTASCWDDYAKQAM